ncbi:MAG: HEAT repeat domain-containing protein [Phycisphaerae bacterium]|nr:HEAT repeat domain-containing protein [Phycisphaerae bacterium]
MSTTARQARTHKWRNCIPLMMIVVTAGACVAALLFRDHLYARICAYRIARADTVVARVSGLTALCDLGDAARGGIRALTRSDDQDLRLLGVIALQQMNADWCRRDLREMLADPSGSVREAAATGLAHHHDEAALPVLHDMAASDDDVTISLCADALRQLGTPRALEALALLEQSHPSLASQPAMPQLAPAILPTDGLTPTDP